jgi:hypothetical protein
MGDSQSSLSGSRRRLLRLIGLGSVGTVTASLGMSGRVFARQFLDQGPVLQLPNMVYEPTLQMMVDPETRQPIYGDSKRLTVASGLPTVTAGCGNCPKKDDDGS